MPFCNIILKKKKKKKTGFDIQYKLSGDNLHEMSNPTFCWKEKQDI